MGALDGKVVLVTGGGSGIGHDLDALPTLAVYPQGEIPLTGGRAGKASDVAHVALFLLSDASAHVSGTEIWVDGAESLLVG